MKKIIVATSNAGKVKELRSRLIPLGLEVSSLKEAGLPLEVVEDAPDFTGNAMKKAVAASDAADCPALADDSGLEVDFLDGRPGVHSARYGGPGLDDRGRYERLLKELEGVPAEKRTARFRAVLAYVEPAGQRATFAGTVEGRIAFDPKGTHGFGYDPVFIPEGFESSMAELGPEVKSKFSHRAKALTLFVEWLSKNPS